MSSPENIFTCFYLIAFAGGIIIGRMQANAKRERQFRDQLALTRIAAFREGFDHAQR